MLVTSLCFLALASQQTPLQRQAPAGRVPLVLYKEKSVLPNGDIASASGRTAMPMLTCIGSCNFTVMDGGIQGVPCKIYSSEGAWSYKAKPKKKSRSGF